MKKIISLVAFLAMTLVTPVNADISPRASGNGFSYGSFMHNGTSYTYNHSFYNIGSGLGVSFYTPARVTRQHSSVRGTFTTASHGIATNYSSAVTYANAIEYSYANPVYCQYSDPTGIVSGDASITVLSNPVFRSDIRINFG